jgi:hypothetical protein
VHALLADVFEVGRELLVEEDDSLAIDHPILRAAE